MRRAGPTAGWVAYSSLLAALRTRLSVSMMMPSLAALRPSLTAVSTWMGLVSGIVQVDNCLFDPKKQT